MNTTLVNTTLARRIPRLIAGALPAALGLALFAATTPVPIRQP